MPEFVLKDWFGKEQTFDHDKIFVKNSDGELIQFAQGEGDAPAVVQPLEVTENGEYTAPAGVDGYSPVTVNVPAPEINLQDKTITENGTYTADSGYDGLGEVLVNIAGSGGSVSIASGEFTAPTTATDITLNHNLGVVPDLILVFPTTSVSDNITAAKHILMGMSDAFAEVHSSGVKKLATYYLTTYRIQTAARNDISITEAGSGSLMGPVTETSIRLPSVVAGTERTMRWIAIAGLV